MKSKINANFTAKDILRSIDETIEREKPGKLIVNSLDLRDWDDCWNGYTHDSKGFVIPLCFLCPKCNKNDPHLQYIYVRFLKYLFGLSKRGLYDKHAHI